MAQYSNFQNFTWDQLEAAKKTRENLSRSLQALKNMLNIDFSSMDFSKNIESLISVAGKKTYDKLIECLCDNLNTLKLLSEVFKLVNKNSDVNGPMTFSHSGLDEHNDIKDLLVIIYFFDINLLKLDLFNPQMC